MQRIQWTARRNTRTEHQGNTIIHDCISSAVFGQTVTEIHFTVGSRVTVIVVARIPCVLNTQESRITFGDDHGATGTVTITKISSNSGPIPLVRGIVMVPGTIKRSEPLTFRCIVRFVSLVNIVPSTIRCIERYLRHHRCGVSRKQKPARPLHMRS